MAVPNKAKHNEYARYAAYCLHLDTTPAVSDSDPIHREMALEWLKLADAALHPHAAS
jgi:hypothetical protein